MNFNIQFHPSLANLVGANRAQAVHGANNQRLAGASAVQASAHKGALAYQFIPNNGLAGQFNRLA